MSLLSLEKYLYTSQKKTQPAQPSGDSPGEDVPKRLLDALGRTLFAGDDLADLAAELGRVRTEIGTESSAQHLSALVLRVEDLLGKFRERLHRANEERATDFNNVLKLLNEAFAHLNTGTEKSDSRMKQLETALGRATQMQDMQTLKNHLRSVLQNVQEEGKRDSAEARGTLEALSRQIRQAHKSTSRFRVQLAGRAEGVAALREQLQHSGCSPYVALFVADTLAVIRVRHGEEIAASLLEELGRQQLQTLAEGGKVFSWSPNSLLLVWNHQEPHSSPSDIPNRLKNPFEHKAFVGTRTATFNVATRSVVMPTQGSLEELEWALDRFSRGGT